MGYKGLLNGLVPISYIEDEFDDLLLVDDYKSLFDFSNFKKFIRLVSTQEK